MNLLTVVAIILITDLNASLAAIPPQQGRDCGKLFNKRKAANSRFGSLRFGRISSFQGGVLQTCDASKIPIVIRKSVEPVAKLHGSGKSMILRPIARTGKACPNRRRNRWLAQEGKRGGAIAIGLKRAILHAEEFCNWLGIEEKLCETGK